MSPTLHVIQGRDAREVSAALGQELKPQIQAALEALPQYEAFRLHQPWWMVPPCFLSIERS
jgi:hypothetical protein